MIDKSQVQKTQTTLIELTAAFCRTHLDPEYEALCQKLIGKMARKRAVPFLSGRVEIWAAAIVYAIGSINFLFDKNIQPYVATDTISFVRISASLKVPSARKPNSFAICSA